MSRPGFEHTRVQRLMGCAAALAVLGSMGCVGGAGVGSGGDDARDVRIAPMLVQPFGVFLQVSFDDSEPVLMRYDTGSPRTVVDASHAHRIGIGGGDREARIGDVEIGPRTIRLVDWIEADITYPGLPGPIKGVVGNDFFKGFAVGLHYAASELWLMAHTDGRPIARPAGTAAEGRSTWFDDASGYLVVPCRFGAATDEQVCLFDTGAINSLLFAEHWDAAAPREGRMVPMITFDNQGNTVMGGYHRADALRTGDIALEDQVVVVVEEFALLASVAAAIREPVAGLIGLSGTFDSYMVIDYPARTISVFPYLEREPPFPSPFVGYGVVVASDGVGGLIVQAVVPGSDAAAAGIRAGDRIVAVDGQPLADAGLVFTIASLIADAPGTRRVFEVQRDGAVMPIEVGAEDLLPRSVGR